MRLGCAADASVDVYKWKRKKLRGTLIFIDQSDGWMDGTGQRTENREQRIADGRVHCSIHKPHLDTRHPTPLDTHPP